MTIFSQRERERDPKQGVFTSFKWQWTTSFSELILYTHNGTCNQYVKIIKSISFSENISLIFKRRKMAYGFSCHGERTW